MGIIRLVKLNFLKSYWQWSWIGLSLNLLFLVPVKSSDNSMKFTRGTHVESYIPLIILNDYIISTRHSHYSHCYHILFYCLHVSCTFVPRNNSYTQHTFLHWPLCVLYECLLGRGRLSVGEYMVEACFSNSHQNTVAEVDVGRNTWIGPAHHAATGDIRLSKLTARISADSTTLIMVDRMGMSRTSTCLSHITCVSAGFFWRATSQWCRRLGQQSSVL